EVAFCDPLALELLLDLPAQLVDPVLVHEHLDARPRAVGAQPLLAVEDPEHRLRDLQVLAVVELDEVVQHLRAARHDRRASADGSPVTLRIVLPQPSRLESPASPSSRIAFSASSSGTWCIWMFWRVVMCPLRSGTYFSITSANASSCSGVMPPKGSFTRIICTSAWRWPYTPWRSRNLMNSSSAVSPDRNFVASVLKSSNSRCRIGITCPGTSFSTSGSSSVPRWVGMETGSTAETSWLRAPAAGSTRRRAYCERSVLTLKPSGFQVFIQGSQSAV